MAFFKEIWLVDFEFRSPDGERITEVHCLVAYEVRSGRLIRLWHDEFGPEPPYPIGPDSLFVAYYASAEIGCHLALGWPVPERILDLCAEFKALTSNLKVGKSGRKRLIDAMEWFGFEHMEALEKEDMRAIAIRGQPFTESERADLLDYCESDVAALEKLLPVMLPLINIPYALIRGRFMTAAARIEWAGIPIDTQSLSRLLQNWGRIKLQLIADMGVFYPGVYRSDGTFNHKGFEEYIRREKIPWPRLDARPGKEIGSRCTKSKTFREMSDAYKQVRKLKELVATLNQLRQIKLAVGKDGRNRVLLGAFGTKTSRNAPKASQFIFGPAVWIRGLIKPPPGYGIAYVDWEQQEFGIAAALSRDLAMQETYNANGYADCYISFGVEKVGFTVEESQKVRQCLKGCLLGVQFGMQEESLAIRIKKPVTYARELLRAHHAAYPDFWKYDDGAVDTIMQVGVIKTVLGWPVHRGVAYKDWPGEIRANSFRNFPMQGNGAELIRWAACLATERGIEVCAMVHDAILICAPLDRLDEDIERTRAAMAEASRFILSGFELRTEAKKVCYPDRYIDKRDTDEDTHMWDRVWRIVENIEREEEEAAGVAA